MYNTLQTMKKYYFTFLVWLLPGYFLFQGSYQLLVYNGLNDTYENGESYVADVIDFEVKQIAAQSNGYVILNFFTNSGHEIEQQLGLTVQMAQLLTDSELIPIRYLENSFVPVVITTTYNLQKDIIRVNLAVSLFGFIATVLIALWFSRFALHRLRHGEEAMEIEIVEI